MSKSHYYYYIIILFCSVACNRPSHPIYEISGVADSDTIESQEIELPIDLLMPTKVLVLDTFVVIYDQSGRNLFHVLQADKFEYKYSFGEIGGGPGEFSNIDPNSIQSFDNDLVFLDNNKLVRMRMYPDYAEPINIQILETGSNPLNRLKLIDDSVFIVDVMEGKKEYRMINLKTGEHLKEFGSYPLSKSRITNDLERYQTFVKASVLNPTKDSFAVFYLYQNKMRIYSNGNLLSETNIRNSYDAYTPDDESGNLIFRAEPVATSNYIYTLNIEKKKKEIDFSKFRPKLEVWNWDGGLLAKYPFDRSIIAFGVSEDLGIGLATSLEHTNKIYSFKLPVPDLGNKQDDSLTYQQVSNNFYTTNIPSVLSYATASPEQEKNKITKHNGFLYNSSYFGVPIEDTNSASFKGSVSVIIASKGDKNDKELTLEEFVKKRDENLQKHASSYSNTVSTINKNKVIISESEYQGVDPKGIAYRTKTRIWRWKEQGKFVEISYNSSENFESYVEDVENIVISLRLKPDKLSSF